MAKIDDYKAAKARAERFRNFATSCRDPGCDKFGAKVKITEDYKGYYGNSSCGSWGGDEIIKAVEAEIALAFRELIDRVAAKAERAAEVARLAAAEEAREVLSEIAAVVATR
jgi:hypothetical protein